MSERRRALVARFRASAIDRLRKVTLALVQVEAGEATPDLLQGVLRDLHTLKGESRMLDFVPLAETVHAVEDRLLAATGADELSVRITATAVLGAVDAAGRWLKDEMGNEGAALESLASAREALLGRVDSVGPGAEDVRVTFAPLVNEPAPARATLPASPGATVAPAPKDRSAERWVSVNARQVDGLSELVSEFEREFRALEFKLRRRGRALGADSAGAREMRALLADFERCRVQLDEIAGWAWGLRLVPVEPLLAELLAHARSLASQQEKRLRVSVDGGHVQLERSIVDALEDPLLHVVRNAVDHGIELPDERARAHKGDASLTIRAESSGPNVILTIEDDGRGIDRQVVRERADARGLATAEATALMSDDDILGLLFVHGFSTRDAVSEVSGRGVGLDVVRSAVERVGGTVRITSEHGAGTRIVLTVPATISQERNLVIESRDALYAIPSRHVVRLLRLSSETVERVDGVSTVVHEEREVPLHSLVSTLGATSVEDEPVGVVLDIAGALCAFAVPKLLGEFSLLRRPIDRLVALSSLLGASSTFEDGRLILILSLPALLRQRRAMAPPAPTDARPPRARVLAIDDSSIVRDLLTEVLSHAGFEVQVAASGELGLAAIALDPPDAVVLDVDMPRLDGFETLRRIRERAASLPVVMLTTRSSAEDRARAHSLGASDYMLKADFDEVALARTLRRLAG